MILWIAATLAAFFVKGLCGFANTLVFTSIMSFGANNVNISPVELLLGFPANVILLVRERKSIQWRLCLPLAGLLILGCVPGALFLKNADAKLIKIFCGAVIIFVGIEMLFRELSNRKSKPSKPILLIVDVLSGLLCGLYGIGALMSAVVSRATDDSHAFKANICAIFFCDNVFRIVLYTLWGIITPAALKQWAVLMPFVLAGLGLGILASRVLDERKSKLAVVAALIVSGAALILNSL